MGYIIALWCGGACKNNGGYNPDKPVVAGYAVHYPRGTARRGGGKKHAMSHPANINQGNLSATSNRKHVRLNVFVFALKFDYADGAKSSIPFDPK
jgi:hypothetical protein